MKADGGERSGVTAAHGRGSFKPMPPAGSSALERARELLRDARAKDEVPETIAVKLAALLLEASREEESTGERLRRQRMAELMADPRAQLFSVALTDRLCRIESPERLLSSLERLVERVGIPPSLRRYEKAGLRGLSVAGSLAPSLTARLIGMRVEKEAEAYLVRGGDGRLARALSRRSEEGFTVNLNHIGEEVIGEAQARHQAAQYLALAERTDVEALSVKVSSLFSQISLVAFEETLAVVSERLRPIFRAAVRSTPKKLVYLDMESYRDLELTLGVFMKLLEEPDLLDLSAGAVLQAYIPDSFAWQRRLVQWAEERVRAGGAPVRLRLVKGANLALERVESSLRGWPVPIFPDKAAVDRQFKAMLRFACEDRRTEAVRMGIGSHNVFDVAYALVLRERLDDPSSIEIEMLEGMADPLRRVVCAITGSLLVYTPTVAPGDMSSAVAYLVRRLDENAAEENFLHHSFAMTPDADTFERERLAFEAAVAGGAASEGSRRENVRGARAEVALERSPSAEFRNEPDTDPSRSGDRDWLRRCLERNAASVDLVPVSVGRAERTEGPCREGFDPSRPGLVPYRHRVATAEEVELALESGMRAREVGASERPEVRAEWLFRVASELRKQRGELISAMVLDGGKRAEEADPEVSEAIDFAEYYARTFLDLSERCDTSPKGTVLVTPPWNFPLAIPLGGVLAALVTGNAVILKPAPETPLVAYLAVRACYDAGIPRELLQFVPCEDSVGQKLVCDPRVDAVVLTGGTSTARLFRRMRPGIDLMAETGGNNCMIVSATSDHEQCVRDAVRSAFGHAGQKCSALRLLVVERALLRDGSFLRKLEDAAGSLIVGSAWRPESFVTPLIAPPAGALKRGLGLEPGERHLLRPETSADNPRLVSPCIKVGVTPGGFTHRTESFGPVLGVLEASDIDHALALANATPYGLTAGFHGLDEDEQRKFIERMDAGNLYVNRGMTGAIVGRQPFGGRKASGFGPGAKAGGPGYVRQFCSEIRRRASETVPAAAASSLGGEVIERHAARARAVARLLASRERKQFERRLQSYAAAQETLVSPELLQDLVGELNWFRHQPCPLAVVCGELTADLDLVSVLSALELLGVRGPLIAVDDPKTPVLRDLVDRGTVRRADLSSIQSLAPAPTRVRGLGVEPPRVWEALGSMDAHFELSSVSDDGLVELPRYLIEQSISVSYHRHGNLSCRRFSPRPRSIAPAGAASARKK